MKRLALAAVLPLAACLDTEPVDRGIAAADSVADSAAAAADPADTTPAPSAPVPAAPPPAAPDPVLARWRDRVPRDLFARRGACPFECCMYNEWTAESPIRLTRAPRDRTVIDSLAPGEAFRADSGTVYVTSIALGVADMPIEGYGPVPPLAAGDTVLLLDHVGEGHWNVWEKGKVVQREGFFDVGYPDKQGHLVGRYGSEWWIHATRSNGARGWFHADTTVRFRGADGCG